MPEKIIGWTLGLFFAFMVAVLVIGPRFGLASEDASPPACHSHAC